MLGSFNYQPWAFICLTPFTSTTSKPQYHKSGNCCCKNIFSRWQLRKLILWKLVHTINANVVRGCSYKKIFYTKIYHTKVSLHENFQIYGNAKHHCLLYYYVFESSAHTHEALLINQIQGLDQYSSVGTYLPSQEMIQIHQTPSPLWGWGLSTRLSSKFVSIEWSKWIMQLLRIVQTRDQAFTDLLSYMLLSSSAYNLKRCLLWPP